MPWLRRRSLQLLPRDLGTNCSSSPRTCSARPSARPMPAASTRRAARPMARFSEHHDPRHRPRAESLARPSRRSPSGRGRRSRARHGLQACRGREQGAAQDDQRVGVPFGSPVRGLLANRRLARRRVRVTRRERGFDTRPDFARMKAKVLYILCRTDALFPPKIAPDVIKALTAAGVEARYFELDSDLGHSSSGPEHAKWSPVCASSWRRWSPG